tara:strand:- start:123 stop:455 length:333 start_codon:yes stop_codon:yes gene_type:complete
MSKPWKKYTDAFKNIDKIAEGIKNNLFKKEHVEAVATSRFQVCIKCSLFDAKGTDCLAPGTHPCCSDCGCSLAFKVRSLSSECPKGYWNSLMPEETEELLIKQIENGKIN